MRDDNGQFGFEYADQVAGAGDFSNNRMTAAQGGGWNFQIYTGNPARDTYGNGGRGSLFVSGAGYLRGYPFECGAVTYLWFRWKLLVGQVPVPGGLPVYLAFTDSTAAGGLGVQGMRCWLDTATGLVHLGVPGLSPLVSTTTPLAPGNYYRISGFIRIANAGTSNAILLLDGDLVGSSFGKTNSLINSVDCIDIGEENNFTIPCLVDDVAINNDYAQVQTSNGVGPIPVVGETYASGGKAGIVRIVHANAAGTAAIFAIEPTGGTSLVATDVIVFSGGYSCVAATDQDNRDRDYPGDGFIIVRSPSAPGATTALSQNGGPLVPNENWKYEAKDQLVLPIDTSVYLSTGAAGVFDTYVVAPGPSEAVAITGAVRFRAYVQKDADGLSHTTAEIRSGVGNYEVPAPANTPTAWAYVDVLCPFDPSTGTGWTPGGLNAAQFGPKALA